MPGIVWSRCAMASRLTVLDVAIEAVDLCREQRVLRENQVDLAPQHDLGERNGGEPKVVSAGASLVFHYDLCNVLPVDITIKPPLVLDEFLERHDREPDSRDRPLN
jgi:hypothetical protein